MDSPTRGLWWKEWRQLRLLRLGGSVMILVVPVLLLAAAEAATRGWAPFGTLADYSAVSVIRDAVPLALAYFVWPLLALMLAAQSFCGDVAAGTEWFWIERPVSPRRVWLLRVLTSSASLGAVIVGHLVIWRVMLALWGTPTQTAAGAGVGALWPVLTDLVPDEAWIGMAVSLLVALTAYLAAIAAAPLARSPMQALLIGMVLAALPVGCAQLLTAAFPFALLGFVPVGALIPLVLLPAYLASSYWACCRGEPAGRGRRARGLAVIASALAAVVVVALPVSAWATHRGAVLGLGNAVVVPAPGGSRVLVYNLGQGAAWLVDTASGETVEKFWPYVFSAAWDSAGERMALLEIDRSGEIAATVYDASGEALWTGIDCGRCRDVTWVEDQLCFRTFEPDLGWGLVFVDPRTGRRREVDVAPATVGMRLLGPTAEGEMLVIAVGLPDDGDRPSATLYPLDRGARTVGPPIVIPGPVAGPAFATLSPSGESLIVARRGRWTIRALGTGAEVQAGSRPVWLTGDRAVWISKNEDGVSVVAGGVDEPRVLRTFPGPFWAELQPSPDGRRLLVGLWQKDDAGGDGTVRRVHWLYDPSTDAWTELEWATIQDAQGETVRLTWTDGNRIAVLGVGVLALRELDGSATTRFVIEG